jgi:hypothetical protein
MKGFPKRAAIVLSLGALSGCHPRPCGPPSPPPPPGTPASYPIHLTIDTSSKTHCLGAHPPIAFVEKDQPVQFIPEALPSGDKVEVNLSVGLGITSGGTVELVKGPFPVKAQDPSNPHRGEYLIDQTYTTLPPNHSGYWKYELVLLDSTGAGVSTCDPADPGLMIKN